MDETTLLGAFLALGVLLCLGLGWYTGYAQGYKRGREVGETSQIFALFEGDEE